MRLDERDDARLDIDGGRLGQGTSLTTTARLILCRLSGTFPQSKSPGRPR
jgi:hypothetical protein